MLLHAVAYSYLLYVLLLLATMATRFLTPGARIARHLVHLKSKSNWETMFLCEDVRSKATVCLWKAKALRYLRRNEFLDLLLLPPPLVCYFGSYTSVASHQSGCRSTPRLLQLKYDFSKHKRRHFSPNTTSATSPLGPHYRDSG